MVRSLRVCLQCLTFSIALASLVLPAGSQMPMACHQTDAMSQMQPVAPPDTLPVPLHLTGIGNSHLKISASPEAQQWFDQGLNLLHDFWDYESARAFEQSVRVDPQCAICYWGLSKALDNYHNAPGNYSSKALAQAVALKSHAGKEERLIIEATAAEEDTHRDLKSLGHNAKAESPAVALWRKAADKDRDNPQPQIFLAESLLSGYDDNGEPRAGTKQAIAILEAALKAHPNDSALNHYWIHAMEPSNHPERAIESSKKLASLAPNSGHMVHMPGHIFYRTGNYAEAEHWFTASTAVDEAYMNSQHVSVDDTWNYVHNLMYSIDNLMQQGKLEEATTLSAKLAHARGQFAGTLYLGSPRDSMTRVNTLLPIALRTGNWVAVQKLLAGSNPDAKLENLLFLSGELQQFAAGMQAIESGDVPSAKLASNALDADLWRKTQALKDEQADKHGHSKAEPAKADTKPNSDAKPTHAVNPDATAEPLLATLSIMSLELRAAMLAAQHDLSGAQKLFTQAEREEKQLGYREPPGYIRPVAETEGLTLLRAGDAASAHESFTRALADRPNSGFALYGMARSSEAAKNATQARDEYAKFLDAWQHADSSSPELSHARDYLKGLPIDARLGR